MAKLTVANPVQRLVDEMNKPLQAVYQKLHTQFTNDNLSSVMTCHDVGSEIVKVAKNEKSYGEGAIEKLATALGRSASVLRAAAQLAETWTKPQLKDMLTQVNSKGAPLTISHFQELMRLADAGKREKVFQECLMASWSSRDLAYRVQTLSGGVRSAGGRSPVTPSGPVPGLTQANKLVANLVNRDHGYDEAVFARIDEMTTGDVTERLLESLQEAKQRAQDLLQFAQSYNRRVDTALQKVNAVITAKEADAKPSRREKATNGAVEVGENEVMPYRAPRKAATAAKPTTAKAAPKPAAATAAHHPARRRPAPLKTRQAGKPAPAKSKKKPKRKAAAV